MGLVKNYINGVFKDTLKQEIGIGGFTTFARVNNKTTKKNNVPITYLEDGSFLEDHIIREPITLSIEGNVSDIFIKSSKLSEQARNTIINFRSLETKVREINQYIPTMTDYQDGIISIIDGGLNNALDEADALIEKSQRVANYIGYLADGSNTTKFIDAMNGIYNSNQTITIEMHDRTYKNMVFTLFETTKDNENNSIDFIIEAQEVRYAVSEVIQVVSSLSPSETLGGATKNIIDKGVQEGDSISSNVEQSILSKLVE